MPDNRLCLLKMPLFPLPALFSDEKQALRKGQVMNDLKILYPRLADVTQCAVDYRYEADGKYLYLVVELTSIPQGLLRFAGDRYASADEQSQLGEIAAAILESGNTTQLSIYQLAREANTSMPVIDNVRGGTESRLEAIVKRYRNHTVCVDTLNGQQQFDFPDFNGLVTTEKSVKVSGFVEHVGRDGVAISSVRVIQADVGFPLPRRSQKLKVFYQRDRHDALALGVRALEAAIERYRVEMQVFVSVDTLSSQVSHFVLDGSDISVVDASQAS